PDGRWLSQKDLRNFVKARFSGGAVVDAWTLHCATLEGMELRKARPDGAMVFGGRKEMERRRKGLISNEDWKQKRLRPFRSRGDRMFLGNRHSASRRTAGRAPSGCTDGRSSFSSPR